MFVVVVVVPLWLLPRCPFPVSLFTRSHQMSRDTNMRGQAQRLRSYSYGQHGRQTRGMMGDHVFRKGSGVEVWKPSWKGTTTTVRIYPALCPENPQEFDPWRFSADDDDYGDWIRTYPAVRNFGDPGVTFILFDPIDHSYDPQTNPCWVLYNAITRAIQAGQANPKWVPYTLGSQGRGAALRRPQDITLIQGAILQHNNKDYDPPRGGAANDATVVLELSGSAANAMLEAMNERNPDFRGDPDDFRGMFVHGDPIALDQGAFVNFYQLGADPRERMQAGQQKRNSFGQARPIQGQGGRGNDDPIGFGCFLTHEYKGMSANLSGMEDLVRRKWKPWDDIIQILGHEDQIRLLSGAFPPDMIVYAFQDMYRDMIPESVWRAYNGRVSAPTGGAVPVQPSHSVASSAASGAVRHRGWGVLSTDDSTQDGSGESQGGADSYPGQEVGASSSAVPVHRAGQRRGFGGQAPTDGEVTRGETAPQQGLEEVASSEFSAGNAQMSDQRTVAASSVQDAIRQSRQRVQQRRMGGAQ